MRLGFWRDELKRRVLSRSEPCFFPAVANLQAWARERQPVLWTDPTGHRREPEECAECYHQRPPLLRDVRLRYHD
jgi:hypothetical protein